MKQSLFSSLVFAAISLAIAKSALAQPSEQLIEAIDFGRSEAVLRDAQFECSAVGDVEQAQVLLAVAQTFAAEVEDDRRRAIAFVEIGKGYACAKQYQQADTALRQALLTVDTLDSTEFQSLMLKDIAGIYGRAIGDVEQMNAVVSQMLSIIESESGPEAPSYYREVAEAASLYAETQQYRQLRNFIDGFDDPSDRLALVRGAAPALSSAESDADRALIASLFSDYDLETIFSQFAQRPEPPEAFSSPAFNYASTLSEIADEGVEDYSVAVINDFVDEQLIIISELPDARSKIESLGSLSRFLIAESQPRAALSVLAIAMQQVKDALEAEEIYNAHFYTFRFHKATANAHFQLGEIEAGIEALAGNSRNPISSTNQINALLQFVNARSTPLSNQQKRELLARAENLVPMVEDNIERLTFQGYIANNYAALGDLEKADELLAAITVAIPTDIEWAEQSALAITYAGLMAATGDVENAIAFTGALQMRSLALFLPGHLVAAGEYELAEEKLAEIIPAEDYFRAAKYAIDEYTTTEDAYAFTARTLKKLQTADLLSEEDKQNLADERTSNFLREYALTEIEEKRMDIAFGLIEEAVLAPDLGATERRSPLTAAESADIQQLISTLDNTWMRGELIQKFFSPLEALIIIDADREIERPDSLLLYSIVELTKTGELGRATAMLLGMRSPYVKARALTYIATRYSSTQ